MAYPAPARFATLTRSLLALVVVVVALSVSLWSPALRAQSSGAYVVYVMEAGDTLIDLSVRHLTQPLRWTALQRLNQIADPHRIPVGAPIRIPVEWLREHPRVAQLEALHGEVRVDGLPVQEGQILAPSHTLQTGADGFATLRLPDGSQLRVRPDTRLRFDELHGYSVDADLQRSTLHLEHGRVESQVAAQRGPAARYRIQTPTAVIGVRGTAFRVATTEQGKSRAEVTAGSVEVSTATQGRARLALQAGQGLQAEQNAVLGPPTQLLPPPQVQAAHLLQSRPEIRIPVAAPPGSVALRAEIAADADFSRVLGEQLGPPDLARFAHLDLTDGDYHLRVRGVDAHGFEGMNAQYALTLHARPVPPFVHEPGTLESAGELEFYWATVPQAQHYRIEIARDAAFTDLVLQDHARQNTRLRQPLEEGHYHWRIASVGAEGRIGPWETRALELRPLPKLDAEPEITREQLRLRWSGPPEQRYGYQFARDPDFNEVLSAGESEVAEILLPRPGSPDLYYFRIRAIDPDGYIGA